MQIELYFQTRPDTEAHRLEVNAATAESHSGYVREELQRAGRAAPPRVYFVASDHYAVAPK